VPESQRKPNPDFVLNQPRYKGASILLARKNFGCGSSREHAPWAIDQYGFRAILAPSFADIFFNNCFKNGLLPIVLPESVIEQLFNEVAAFPGYELTIDLERQVVVRPQGEEMPFDVQPFRKYCLLNGLDDIGLTLRHKDKIAAYDQRRHKLFPLKKQRYKNKYPDSPFYGWSEDKARHYSMPERADFGAFVREKGFSLK